MENKNQMPFDPAFEDEAETEKKEAIISPDVRKAIEKFKSAGIVYINERVSESRIKRKQQYSNTEIKFALYDIVDSILKGNEGDVQKSFNVIKAIEEEKLLTAEENNKLVSRLNTLIEREQKSQEDREKELKEEFEQARLSFVKWKFDDATLELEEICKADESGIKFEKNVLILADGTEVKPDTSEEHYGEYILPKGVEVGEEIKKSIANLNVDAKSFLYMKKFLESDFGRKLRNHVKLTNIPEDKAELSNTEEAAVVADKPANEAETEKKEVELHPNVEVDKVDLFKRGEVLFTPGEVAVLVKLNLANQGRIYSLINQMGLEKMKLGLSHFSNEPADAKATIDLCDFPVESRTTAYDQEGNVVIMNSENNFLTGQGDLEKIKTAGEEGGKYLTNLEDAKPNIEPIEKQKDEYVLTNGEYVACLKLGLKTADEITRAITIVGEEKFHLGLSHYVDPKDENGQIARIVSEKISKKIKEQERLNAINTYGETLPEVEEFLREAWEFDLHTCLELNQEELLALKSLGLSTEKEIYDFYYKNGEDGFWKAVDEKIEEVRVELGDKTLGDKTYKVYPLRRAASPEILNMDADQVVEYWEDAMAYVNAHEKMVNNPQLVADFALMGNGREELDGAIKNLKNIAAELDKTIEIRPLSWKNPAYRALRNDAKQTIAILEKQIAENYLGTEPGEE